MQKLLVLLLALVALASPTDAAAETGGSFSFGLEDPAPGPHDDPRAPFFVVDHLAPGDAVTRGLRVANRTGGALQVSLYPAAASIADGSFRFGEGRSGNELTSWMEVRPSRLRVEAGGTRSARLHLAVPEGARPGERYGMVWAELAPQDGSNVVNRVGIRVYLSIGDGGAPRTEVDILSLTPRRDDAGRAIVDVATRNVGGRAYELVGTVELRRDGDDARERQARIGTTTTPGEAARTVATFDGEVDPGRWRAVVDVTVNGVRTRARATLDVPARAGAQGPVARAELVADPRPATALVAAAVLVAACTLALGARIVRRRRVSP